jgi:hypothetical protein
MSHAGLFVSMPGPLVNPSQLIPAGDSRLRRIALQAQAQALQRSGLTHHYRTLLH